MRKIKHFFLLIIISSLANSFAVAQQKTISGVVNDSTGKPLAVLLILSAASKSGALPMNRENFLSAFLLTAVSLLAL
ncbi:MAG: hypothetical protein ABIN89_24000 [Chitinophagaceae bacterium]